MRRASLAGFVALSLVIPQAHAQDTGAARSEPPGFVASFRWTPLAPPRHPALVPGGRLGPHTVPALVAAAWERRARALWSPVLGRPAAPVPVAAAAPAPIPAEPAPPVVVPAAAPALPGTFADVGMQLNVRFELKADQFRNLHCSAIDLQQALSGCSAGFPTISPNPQYSIRSGGVVGQRLHLNVDFDSQREFDANNNLQVWYEGLEDEPLRRVEAGNVTFQTPRSRFISAAIPANNFGVQAIAQFGALELRGIYAQQKGNVVTDRVYTIGDVTTQPIDREARDLDYEAGRFFFAVDPAAIPGYPAVDILSLEATPLPAALRVGGLHVYRVRAVSPLSNSNQNIGGLRAVACGPGAQPVDCVAERAGPFQWEILLEGRDYYADPSGAWFALASRLDQSDYLAVSYIPVGETSCSSGRCVGTFPVTARPDPSFVDTLRLVYDPRPGVTAATPSFRFEIRSAYRVGGSEVTRETVALALTVNRRERTVAADETYLARLGLALASDPNTFDQYNRLFPRTRDPLQGAPVRDYFVVFPHLAPFADSAKLDASERNDSLYRTPRALLATQGPPSVFALQLHANVSASPDRSLLSLNSFQIRDGSERIYVGNTLLTRGTDYTIDYATGQVQFRNADALFPLGGVAQVRAQFEERAAFAVSPTSIFGLAGRYDLGARGTINFTGLFQREQSAFTRPPLGSEPASSFIAGVSTELHFRPAWITRALDKLPGVHTDAPSFLNVSAEIAMSRPGANPAGQAYLEEFEGEAGRFLSLAEQSWQWGSIPTTARGAEPFGIAPGGFAPPDAAALRWQNLPYDASGRPMQFLPQQIDPTIRLVGQGQSAEPVLWLMLKPDTVLGLADSRTGAPNWVRPHHDGPRWRAITQVLSPTGIDLSRVEFLELWVWEDNHRVAKAANTALLLDFGSVFEDALAFVPETLTVTPPGDTVYSGERPAGLGRLDTERDPLTHSWSATQDDEGILSDRIVDGVWDATQGRRVDTLPLCSARVNGALPAYAFGDLRSRCGRHNGAVDTEDQDGDFLLDSLAGVKTREDFVRFVFPIGDDRYFVRDGGMVSERDSFGNPDGASGWRLYRIPFRTDTITQGSVSLRQIQSLRVTIVTPQNGPLGRPDPQVFFGLARVRLVGATWVKRADTPIPGLAGERGTGTGEVVASVVSTENQDLGYTSPPGVIDEASRRDAGLQVGVTQINEQSLRLLARGLATGQHAEAFVRFTTAGDKNFLKYRRLRVWARGRGTGWDEGDLHFYVKAGKDENNFYLYHVPAGTTSWEPEVVVDLERWLVLRARIERAWLHGDTAQVYSGCPATIVPFDSAYVMCDGPYVAHVRNPGTAPPNLAAVQEMAAGILRVDSRVLLDQAELWVDDIRLSDVVQDAGYAGAVDVTLTAADVADVAISVSRRDAQFHQLGEDPSYAADHAASVAGTVRLDRFLPDRWGIAAPLTVRYAATSSDPFYLAGTDLRGDALDGLRTPQSRATSYSLSLRRTRQARSGLLRTLLDPAALSASYSDGTTRSDLASATASSYALGLDYNLTPGAARWGPLRLNPANIRFRTGIAGSEASRFTYLVPVARAADALAVPALSRTKLWRSAGGFDLLPLGGVQLRVDVASQRDLRDYGDSTTIGRLVRQERRTFLGRDVGIETQRSITTLLSLTPQVAAWVRPRATLATGFFLSRDPNARDPVRDVGDTAGGFHIPVAFGNSRRVELGAQLDARRAGRALFGDSAGVVRLLGRLTGPDVSYGRSWTSTYDRTPLTPSLGYQLALVGFSRFREQDGMRAGAAADNYSFNLGGGAELPVGLRVRANYQRLQGITWVLRTDQQVPLRTRGRDWPSATVAWSVAAPRGAIARLLASLTAQVTYRRRESATEQSALIGDSAGAARTQLTERYLTPTVALTWVKGILSSFDAARLKTEQLAAGNLFRSERNQAGGNLVFAFRPPASLARMPRDIRTTLRYQETRTTSCLQAAGQAVCVPYVDSRQAQAQLTLDTEFPPSLSAGFQMAYLVNDERQASRKTSQLVITAFVNLSTSVGQIR